MIQDQIMKLVDALTRATVAVKWLIHNGTAAEFKLATDAEDVARAAVVAAIEQLTKDVERLDHIQVTGSTVEIVNFGQKPVQHSFRVGGLYKAINFDLRLAIDAAITAQKEQV